MAESRSAEKLLATVAETYATCASYHDEGEMMHFSDRGGRLTASRPAELLLRTWLVRPDHFRFEWAERDAGPEEKGERLVIWMQDGAPRSWWTLQPDEVDESPEIGMHLWETTAVSRGSTIVPRMLFESEGHRWLDRGSPAQIEGSEAIDGHECIVVRIDHPRRGTIRAWIDKKTNLIRRISETKIWTEEAVRHLEERMKQAEAELRQLAQSDPDAARALETMPRSVRDYLGDRDETTWTYKPELNPQIDPAVFDFTPPVAP